MVYHGLLFARNKDWEAMSQEEFAAIQMEHVKHYQATGLRIGGIIKGNGPYGTPP
jgi:hypothetical protein